MKSGYCVITAWLLVAPLLAQPEKSQLEASIPPAKLEELVSSRRRAQEELRPSVVDDISPQILRWFVEPGASVAVVRMEQVVADGDRYAVTLVVEKALRGAPPAKLDVNIGWSEYPCRLMCGERIRPLTGKRALAGLITVDSYTLSDPHPTLFVGILDLDNPSDASFLPSATAAAKMDADSAISGFSSYVAGLTSENPVIHELAMRRLLDAKDCSPDSHCQESIFSEIRKLLFSQNPRQRMNAVQWLGSLAARIESCQRTPCGPPEFDREPIQKLLAAALQDKNVAVGDLAFQYLSTLEFREKGNAGYCEEIVPALRTAERYPFTDEDHRIIGGRLDGASICEGPAQE